MDKLMSLLFPKRCPFCNEVLESFHLDICPECEKIVDEFYLIEEPTCKKCGKPLADEEQEFCLDCKKNPRSFEQGICLFRYGHRQNYRSMGESILRFKYSGALTYASYYIRKLIETYTQVIRQFEVDAIFPIPVHKSRYKQRGYNQAEVLAKELSKQMNIPVYSRCLLRTKKTSAQKELTKEERARNLALAFEVKQLPKDVHRVLLIDDIYTTGVTMEACTRVLLQAGIEKVYVASICSGQN
ncbi:Competence protein F [Lachnospiraceae bacterium TWA4]|nr:Competence protein F [Lachnospiraceae bacterium TWA4]